jgi:Asp-tRNA(Asn)/Glu-tRNA(Gln) amidotransferase A subunit family amidase
MPNPTSQQPGVDRRRFLALATSLAALPALAGAAEEPAAIPDAALAAAEKLLGLELSEAERALMKDGLVDQLADYREIREVPIANDVPPAVVFDPLLPGRRVEGESTFRPSAPAAEPAPTTLDEVAFWPVTRLAGLVRSGEVRPSELTAMYLDRLRRLDPALHAVVNLTADLAMRQAERADGEIAAGRWRGPLHGIPWGAKDLLSARGYPTTWGSVVFREQVIDEDATVVDRLAQAGAVLVAKLSLGEIAWGDVWFGGVTRNPWNLEQGSSGSSAGSAAATAAGAAGFTIGSETLGSIVSPCTRTGSTGLRPTFGRVSRHGAMALSWSMDKLGPICRSVEDCALVLQAIHGADGRDPAATDAPFAWDAAADPRKLRVGWVRSLFEAPPAEGNEEWHAHDLATIATLRELGFELREIELPDIATSALSVILTAEAAAAFDELTRGGRDGEMVRQVAQAWPNVWRLGQTIPAVSYLQANRIRTLLMREMERLFADVDAYVVPTYGGSHLLLTNLTGHPAVVVPNGFRKNGTPTSVTFMAGLFREGDALLVARAYQEATGFHLRHPALGELAPTPAFPLEPANAAPGR